MGLYFLQAKSDRAVADFARAVASDIRSRHGSVRGHFSPEEIPGQLAPLGISRDRFRAGMNFLVAFFGRDRIQSSQRGGMFVLMRVVAGPLMFFGRPTTFVQRSVTWAGES